MKQHSRSARCGTQDWAGSARGDGAMLDGALIDACREADPECAARLDELRGKIADTGYVEGAVTMIASFLSARYGKGKSNDRRA